jgi:carboxypeptidase PM20D1
MIALYIILALIVIFLAVVLIRAARFVPPAEKARESEDVEFDRDTAVYALQELVRCKTVSSRDPSVEDDTEFEKLIGLLPGLYRRYSGHARLPAFPAGRFYSNGRARRTANPRS